MCDTPHQDVLPIRQLLSSPEYGPASIADSFFAPGALNEAGPFFSWVPNTEPVVGTAGPSLTCGLRSASSLISPLSHPASCLTSSFSSQPASELFHPHYSGVTGPAPFPVPSGSPTVFREAFSPVPDFTLEILHGQRDANGQTAQVRPDPCVSDSMEARGAAAAFFAPATWPTALAFEQDDFEGSVRSQYTALAGAHTPSSPMSSRDQCQWPQQSEPFSRMPISRREGYTKSRRPSPHPGNRGASRHGNIKLEPRVLATAEEANQDKAGRILRASRKYRFKMARKCNEASEEAKRVTLQHELLMEDVEQLSKEIYNLKAEVLAQSGCGCPLMQAYLTHEAWQTYGQVHESSSVDVTGAQENGRDGELAMSYAGNQAMDRLGPVNCNPG